MDKTQLLKGTLETLTLCRKHLIIHYLTIYLG